MDKKGKTAIETLEELSKLPANAVLTKKELEKLLNISDVTISKSIEASTLLTSARSYTVQELKEWFVPARAGIDEGKTYEEVKQMLLEKRGVSESATAANADEAGSLELLDSMLFEGMTTLIEGRLEQFILHTPQILSGAVVKLLSNPKIRAEILKKVAISVKSEPIAREARTVRLENMNLLPESKSEE